uniref:DUF4342 domain-containing protein n=1 Tax=Strongyloides papillosus TaxID=174720 RepID=A0A0N5C849_STREA
MVFNFIRAFLNREEVIRKLSNSYPIRMAARVIVRTGFKAIDVVQNSVTGKEIIRRKKIFLETFKEEFKKRR